ncbi:UDP-N-acetylgalactosamine-undecaprenyl-phosphate N-acetylgalactosaminephosphotransferase [Planctopirus ephydatiae]|uniref:UDP-N-acetylgalactosamine-undecaprenyl-phosphate N-acetylgalactosaminephosphotransferase n=1 Tax=Planctopirus ephydatiae TaxID=2528019 RepID=A0A518GTL1_9PLAN|nr:sugar transferase [Planctopirus ephydatiae]QDV31926.1 UDP-N-acetylgalactosamine-undecaprenyl-phosphate N-acetylgalactosaminephosphotransferase [Planctopirus ephydatiae]
MSATILEKPHSTIATPQDQISTTLPNPSARERDDLAGSDFADLYDQYVADDSTIPPQWLTQLKLEKTRRSTRCLSEGTRLAKRVMDIVGALVLIAATAPLMVLAAILVRVSSPGPIIFCQTRVGLNQRKSGRRDRRNQRQAVLPPGVERRHPENNRRKEDGYGKPFTLYKFRTMRTDAEKNGAQFAVQGDPRVTPAGRFMRKTRLDELPQLWNVLKGEMSLVGPRPERPEFIEKLSAEIPNYINRLGLKPGLTGLAQVINGYDNDIESFRRKVNLDLLYLQNCSIWNDFKILLRTVRVVLTGSGAL